MTEFPSAAEQLAAIRAVTELVTAHGDPIPPVLDILRQETEQQLTEDQAIGVAFAELAEKYADPEHPNRVPDPEALPTIFGAMVRAAITAAGMTLSAPIVDAEVVDDRD